MQGAFRSNTSPAHTSPLEPALPSASGLPAGLTQASRPAASARPRTCAVSPGQRCLPVKLSSDHFSEMPPVGFLDILGCQGVRPTLAGPHWRQMSPAWRATVPCWTGPSHLWQCCHDCAWFPRGLVSTDFKSSVPGALPRCRGCGRRLGQDGPPPRAGSWLGPRPPPCRAQAPRFQAGQQPGTSTQSAVNSSSGISPTRWNWDTSAK